MRIKYCMYMQYQVPSSSINTGSIETQMPQIMFCSRVYTQDFPLRRSKLFGRFELFARKFVAKDSCHYPYSKA